MVVRKTVFSAPHLAGLKAWLNDKCTIGCRHVGHPNAARLVFTIGESNAGGIVPLANATAAELAPRPETKIINNTAGNFMFETLDVGTNNLIDHTTFTDNNSFGIEVGLANVQEDSLPYGQFLYLLKNGHGGSETSGWIVYTGGSGSCSRCPSALRARWTTSRTTTSRPSLTG